MELRPASCKFVELHVLYVPDDQWNVKLNKVPVEAIESFISAGFIRVYPDLTLKTLRNKLAALLGAERSINTFSFLKCVGHSLALVKSEQEREVKVKTFAPPYAPQPELYLLPAVDSDSSVCSHSLTPDTSSSSPDRHTYYPPKMCSLPAGIKGPVKLPHNAQSSHPLPPPTPSLEEEEEEEEEEEKESEEEQSCSFSEEQNEEEVFSSNKRQWMKHEYCRKKSQENTPQSVSVKVCKALPRCEGDSAQTKDSQKEEASCRKTKQYHRGSRAARDSGVAESLEDRDSGFSFTYRLGKSKDTHTLKSYGNIKNVEVTEGAAVLPGPVRYSSHPRGINLVVAAHKVTAAAAPAFKMNREELIEEIQLAREERKQLEWMRQELLRKGKDLLAQNRHRRNQARDSWKKKYFETKKAAAPLENNLRNLRQELEIFYTKLLHQLHARENRGKPKRQSRTSIKNELIIEIMTESHEIDNLKRKIENAKMKLLTEVKLRKQAATELRALKAELAQKKSQLSHPRPGFCLAFGTLTRDKPRAQNTSI